MTKYDIVEQECQSILQRWGVGPQIYKTAEECAELIQVLMKNLNNQATAEQVIDEIADVIIMTQQMRLVFGAAAVDDRVMIKLKRASNASH